MKNYLDLLSPSKYFEKMYIPNYYALNFFYLGLMIWIVLSIATEILFPHQPFLLRYGLFFLIISLAAGTGYFYGLRLTEKTGKKIVKELAPHHRWDWTESRSVDLAIGIFCGFVFLFGIVYLILFWVYDL